MTAGELRAMTVEDLRDKETELSERLFSYRLQRVTGQLEKPSKVREAKRDLARVLTILNQKQRQEQAETSEAAGD